ncbi:unnamed protein product [Notodromas monacha]|uniref:TOG domain-containing protein n=1 Tax=Notodromas monacha TaxID=399045 RepID=A0A7R9BG72_9CRUS|nr:unnamed protein product [Notodromas monacha]CAG0914034.1 unnamed protein product [Notodromas monacha]
MAGIDEFIPLLNTADTKKKLAVGASIITFLEDPDNSIVCEDIGRFVDLITGWINSSHYKICQNGIDILCLILDRMKEAFRPYLSKSLPAAVDRLGDQRDVVRNSAHIFIMRLLETDVLTPQLLFERLAPSFAHKSNKVREELMVCLQNVLNEYGANALSLSRLMPNLVKLLSDPQATVREVAVTTMVEIYRHVGEKMRADLMKKYNLPAAKMQVLSAKFDEVRDSGTMLALATNVFTRPME